MHCYLTEIIWFANFLSIFQLLIYYMLVSQNRERLILVKSEERLAVLISPSVCIATNQLAFKFYVNAGTNLIGRIR